MPIETQPPNTARGSYVALAPNALDSTVSDSLLSACSRSACASDSFAARPPASDRASTNTSKVSWISSSVASRCWWLFFVTTLGSLEVNFKLS